MTLRERLSSIGLAFRGKLPTKEVIKEVQAEQKSVLGGYIDLFKNSGLVTESRVSDKLLAANQGWVYRNNDVIAKEVATIEFELFTTRIVGQEIVFNPITTHPLLDALDRFNEFTDASSGFYITQSHRKLAGDAFWYIEGSGPNIKGIYPLQPDKVELGFGDPSYGQAIINMYKFRSTINGQQVEEDYKPEEIIHFKIPNPANPYRGKSAVEAAAEAIDTDSYAIEANKALFKRGLITNFVLATEGKLSPEQVQQLKADLNSNYSGVGNAYRAMILSGGLTPHSIQLSNKDMEFIEQQRWLRDKIMSIFGNNRAVLGITEDVNRANAEASIIVWKQTTVKAEMKAITDTLNEFLVPRFGTNLILGFKDPVPEDRKVKIEEAKALTEAKIITQNEARDMLGYKPVKDEGADILNRPMPELQPKEPEIPKSVQNVSYKHLLRRSGLYMQREQKMELLEAARPIAKRIIKQRRKQDTVEPREHVLFTNDKVWEFHDKQVAVVEAQEQRFHNKLEQFIQGLVERALLQVPEEVAAMQRKALMNEQDEVVRAMIDFTPLLHEVAIVAGQQALQLINDDKPYISMDLRSTIERSVRKFAQSMIETDKNKIIDMIAQGIAKGESIPTIRRNIQKEFVQFSKSQAERITRTEVIRASNFGSLDAWQHSDVVVGKQWLTARDDRVEALCASMNGKIIPLKTNFFDKGEEVTIGDHTHKFDYGSIKVPPPHPNCRCTLLPVLQTQRDFIPEEPKDFADKQHIKELEEQIDKRTKAYRDLKDKSLDDKAYINALENLHGMNDE